MFDAALSEAAIEAVKATAAWVVPGALAAGAVYVARKREAIRARIQRRRDRKAAFEALLSGFPELRQQVSKITAQVHPNGGGSLMDAVNRTEGAVREQRSELAGVKDSIGAIEVMVRAASDLATEGEFECDSDGSLNSANLSFARIVGVGRAELLNHGWKNFIHPEDAPAFLQTAEQCFAENRTFSGKIRIVRPTDGAEIRVDIVVMPYPDTPPSRWFGKVRIIP